MNSIGQSCADSEEKISSSSPRPRQPLADIDVNTLNSECVKESSQQSISFSFVSESDQENLPSQTKKRSRAATNVDPPRKKQKKGNVKALLVGQKIHETRMGFGGSSLLDKNLWNIIDLFLRVETSHRTDDELVHSETFTVRLFVFLFSVEFV